MENQNHIIQQLSIAERRGKQIILEARERKEKKLKEAKRNAQEDIENYRLKRESQFLEFQAKHMESFDNAVDKIEQDTNIRIDELNRTVANQKDKVVKQLLDCIYNIKLELHKNFNN